MIDHAHKNLFGGSKYVEWIDENSKCDENTGRIHYSYVKIGFNAIKLAMNDNVNFFRSVSIDGTVYKIKDYVYIDNADMPDNIEKAFIGRISDLFDNGNVIK